MAFIKYPEHRGRTYIGYTHAIIKGSFLKRNALLNYAHETPAVSGCGRIFDLFVNIILNAGIFIMWTEAQLGVYFVSFFHYLLIYCLGLFTDDPF